METKTQKHIKVIFEERSDKTKEYFEWNIRISLWTGRRKKVDIGEGKVFVLARELGFSYVGDDISRDSYELMNQAEVRIKEMNTFEDVAILDNFQIHESFRDLDYVAEILEQIEDFMFNLSDAIFTISKYYETHLKESEKDELQKIFNDFYEKSDFKEFYKNYYYKVSY